MTQSPEEKNKATSANHVKAVQSLYPDERLVAFLSRRFNKTIPNGQYNALDIGFGGGRHIKLLLEFGFQTYGIDYTQEALAATQKIVAQRNYPNLADLFCGNYREFNPPVKFDVVVGWGLLPHSFYPKIAEDLNTIAAMMTVGGRVYVNFRTVDNWFFAKGEQVDTNTYVLGEEALEYQGYTYSFVKDEVEIQQILNRTPFTLLSIERMDLWKNSLKQRHSWMICELKKQS